MITTTYHNVNDFLHKTQVALEANEAVNNLMLGLAFLIRQHPERLKHRPYFITVEDRRELALAGLMMPPRQLILYSERADVDRACRLVVQDLAAQGREVPGVLGRSELSKRFAETWAEMTGGTFWPGMSQRVYEVRRVMPPEGVPGRLRPATATDLKVVTPWGVRFVEEALGETDRAGIKQATARRVADGEVYVWEVDGQPVSMAAKARAMSTGIVVNFVYTPPDLRGRGYASACVAALSQLLLDSGWQFCALFTDLANPTSNKIYQALGYVPLADVQQYLFRKP